eukprot:TRINITY_DN341_c0_g1_i1.p1 TRINITY_DN341_c0_g1~~TRINITY_DN341_c0_g1_i1.p1  ORF type:complete len:107 (-),score=8.20 TRINITY_DN341_c0_g1_i1:27-347(-)
MKQCKSNQSEEHPLPSSACRDQRQSGPMCTLIGCAGSPNLVMDTATGLAHLVAASNTDTLYTRRFGTCPDEGMHQNPSATWLSPAAWELDSHPLPKAGGAALYCFR